MQNNNMADFRLLQIISPPFVPFSIRPTVATAHLPFLLLPSIPLSFHILHTPPLHPDPQLVSPHLCPLSIHQLATQQPSDTKACSLGHIMWLSRSVFLYRLGECRSRCLLVWLTPSGGIWPFVCCGRMDTDDDIKVRRGRSDTVITQINLWYYSFWTLQPCSWITSTFEISVGMSAQEVLTTSNCSSLHFLSDTHFLSTPSVSVSHTQTHWHTHTHTDTHTRNGILIHTAPSLLRLVTHTLVFRGYQSAECKLSPTKTVTCRQRCLAPCGNPSRAPGTRTSHYFHGKGQKLCHLTLKWHWVESPQDNDQRSVFCFASRAACVDLRGTGCSQICLWAPFGHSGFQTWRFR